MRGGKAAGDGDTRICKADASPEADDSGRRTGAWAEEEDALLCTLVKDLGTKSWTAIAKRMAGMRSGKSCRLRWHNQLNPNVNKNPFTEWEQAVIVKAQAHESYANRWAAVARLLQCRTDNAVKNHWHATLKRKVAAGDTDNRYLSQGLSLEWLLAHPEHRDPQEIAASSGSKKVMVAVLKPPVGGAGRNGGGGSGGGAKGRVSKRKAAPKATAAARAAAVAAAAASFQDGQAGGGGATSSHTDTDPAHSGGSGDGGDRSTDMSEEPAVQLSLPPAPAPAAWGAPLGRPAPAPGSSSDSLEEATHVPEGWNAGEGPTGPSPGERQQPPQPPPQKAGAPSIAVPESTGSPHATAGSLPTADSACPASSSWTSYGPPGAAAPAGAAGPPAGLFNAAAALPQQSAAPAAAAAASPPGAVMHVTLSAAAFAATGLSERTELCGATAAEARAPADLAAAAQLPPAAAASVVRAYSGSLDSAATCAGPFAAAPVAGGALDPAAPWTLIPQTQDGAAHCGPFVAAHAAATLRATVSSCGSLPQLLLTQQPALTQQRYDCSGSASPVTTQCAALPPAALQSAQQQQQQAAATPGEELQQRLLRDASVDAQLRERLLLLQRRQERERHLLHLLQQQQLHQLQQQLLLEQQHRVQQLQELHRMRQLEERQMQHHPMVHFAIQHQQQRLPAPQQHQLLGGPEPLNPAVHDQLAAQAVAAAAARALGEESLRPPIISRQACPSKQRPSASAGAAAAAAAPRPGGAPGSPGVLLQSFGEAHAPETPLPAGADADAEVDVVLCPGQMELDLMACDWLA